MAIGLDRHWAKVTITHRVLGEISIGDELLNEASDMGTDLIVTGGFGHSRVYDFVLGRNNQLYPEMHDRAGDVLSLMPISSWQVAAQPAT